MALIEWTTEYSVGIESLDDQHKNLLEIINRFEDARSRGKGSKVMHQILNDIIGYTQEHFAFEEKLMKEIDYPGLKAHQSKHRQLLQKVERLQFEYLEQGRRITTETGEFFNYWLTSHILQHDMEYAEFFQNAAIET